MTFLQTQTLRRADDMDNTSHSYAHSSGPKNPRWTDEEWTALVDLIEEERSILYRSYDPIKSEDGKCVNVKCVTFAQKQQCWGRIQQKLAALGISPHERSAKEIKKRKECMFSKIKKKTADLADRLQQPAVGGEGGRPSELTSLEMRVVAIMGQASVEDSSDADGENHTEIRHRPIVSMYNNTESQQPPAKRKRVTPTYEVTAGIHPTSTPEDGSTLLDMYNRLARATEEQTHLLRQLVQVQQQRLAIDAKRLQYLELDRGSYH